MSRNVAIIGGGPRSLWAVEELIDRARAELTVTVFDPHPAGAGAVYRPDQPTCWRLNVSSSIVRSSVETFGEWCTHRGIPAEEFPPRAVVGQFLADAWAAAVHRSPANLQLRHLPRLVHAVHQDADGRYQVIVSGEPESAAKIAQARFDEVLVCTGHAHDHPTALHHRPSAVPVTGLYFGADLPTSPRRIGTRGAALSFIDVCLRYPEAETIYPVSRSGRFMEVKPPLPEFPSYLHAAARTAGSAAEVRKVLIDAALTLGDFAAAQLHHVLDGEDFTGDAVAEFHHSLRVARGDAPLHAAGAIGVAFRGLFNNFVDHHAHDGVIPGFAELARTLERVSFGPPPITAQVLADALDSGQVDTTYLARPETIDEWMGGSTGPAPDIDLLIDATIAPQGRPTPFSDVPGVVEIGRRNEKILPGHDSLSRDNHTDIPRWAEKVGKP